MTHHERIDANSGMLILSAALHNTKLDGKENHHFRVMVPARHAAAGRDARHDFPEGRSGKR